MKDTISERKPEAEQTEILENEVFVSEAEFEALREQGAKPAGKTVKLNVGAAMQNSGILKKRIQKKTTV